MSSRATFASFVIVVASATGCRCSPDRPPGAAEELDDAAPAVVAPGDAAQRPSHAAEPKADLAAWLDGGVDPACSGPSIDLAVALAEDRCAITSSAAQALRKVFETDSEIAHALKQEARWAEDGRLEISLRHRGSKPLTLPLSWHPKIPAFLVLADDPTKRAVYELVAPPLEVARGDGGESAARFAHIVLAPGDRAFARIRIDPTVVRRIDHDGGLPRLPNGRWTLHVGQLVTDVESGEPAMIAWDVVR